MTDLIIKTQVTTPDGKKFDSVEAAQTYLNTKKFLAEIDAWIDAKGFPSGKGNRRKSIRELIAMWELDKEASSEAEAPAEEPTL